MYPNQPPQSPPGQQNSLDYLNEIAGPAKAQTLNPLILWGGIGGILFVIAIVAFMLFGATSGTSSNERFTAYIHRLQSLKTITEDNNKVIQNSQLRGLNGSTLSILGTAEQESNSVLSAAGLKTLPKASEESSVADEFTKLSTTLEDARLNAVFDRTYAREMTYQLTTLNAEIDAISKSTRSSSLKEYLQKTSTNITPLIEDFSSFNNSEG